MKRTGVLCAVVVTLVVIATTSSFLSASYAQGSGVTVTSHSVDKTIIITMENSGGPDIHSVKLWIAEDNSFESFKTSGGWVGEKQTPNLLIFTSSSPITTGGSAKFGVMVAAETAAINWQALDATNSEISRNTSIPDAGPPVPDPGGSGSVTTPPPTDGDNVAISDASAFKIIPSGPNVGSTVRVVGEGFGADKTVMLLLGSLNLDTIETGDSGRFVHTVNIPETTPADRVEFALVDGTGGTLQKSVRLGEARARVIPNALDGLTINDIPSSATGGETIELSGTGTPGSFMIITLRHPSDYAIRIDQIRIDSNGLWSDSFRIPASAAAGKYTAIVTDGVTTLTQSWDVTENVALNVLPSRLSFDPGDELVFRGTTTPNANVIARLQNPQNIPIYEDAIEVGSSGAISFEIPTMTSYAKGTYVLFLSQDMSEAVVPVGIGGSPNPPFVITLDQLNYSTSDVAIISIQGQPNSDATLTTTNIASKNTLLNTPVALDADGLYVHQLDISEYSKGIYSATVSYGKNSADREFGINLQENAGEINVSTIKTIYSPTEPIIVLGESAKIESLVNITLVSPSGEEVDTVSTFSEAKGTTKPNDRFKANFFTIFFVHSNAERGTWKVIVSSGNNSAETSFEVVTTRSTDIHVSVNEIVVDGNKSITISGDGASPRQQIQIIITHERGEVIEAGLLARVTSDGTFSTAWPNSDDLLPGMYTILVSDLDGNSAETTYTIE